MKYTRGLTAISVALEDAPATTGRHPYSDTTKEIVPTHVSLRYSAATPGRVDATLTGPVVKKDGGLGKTNTDVLVVVSLPEDHKGTSSGRPMAPKWLRQIAEEFAP